MSSIKVGYLPLYIELYDKNNPHYRDPMVAYMETLVRRLEAKGLEVVVAPVCRLASEFQAACDTFNEENVTAVITQHLAYSPSLESIDALCCLKAPIVILDTTPNLELLEVADHEKRVSNNHGIHGVMDMCNLLQRRHIPYTLCVGHVDKRDVIDKVVYAVKGAAMKKAFCSMRIGSVGGDFTGMGDFRIPEEQYAAFGMEIVRMTKDEAEKYVALVTDEELAEEKEYNAEHYTVEVKNEANYDLSLKSGLAVRKWMNDHALNAATINFLHIDESGLPKMPFIECTKIEERAIGYAGEGDTLTAALVGAIFNQYTNSAFTELFCPDWKEDVILLSHMGESNPRLAKWAPVITDLPFKYNSAGDTVSIYSCVREGNGLFVNLAPLGDKFRLILTEVELLDCGLEHGAYRYANQGWLKPCKPIDQFLEEYSYVGGTHHAALVFDYDLDAFVAFGRMMGFEVVVIR